MPLIDRFGRSHIYLRISVTDRCNLRCVYCMPAQGVAWQPREQILTLEEIARVARVAVGLGIEKIRLTGGEPLVRQNLLSLVKELADLPGLKTLAMTTNGVLLGRQAAALRQAGLGAINLSLDTLKPERFRDITQSAGLSEALAGLEAALAAGFAPVKLNVVVLRGINEDEALDFVELVRTRPIEVRFIEYMPFPGNPWQQDRWVPWGEVYERIAARYTLKPIAGGGTARGFSVENFAGTIGFISPLSDEFCARCNRLRLTADGAIKSCLFYPAEIPLRETLRSGVSDVELAGLMSQALERKPRAHPAECHLPETANRCMFEIGG